MRAPPHILYSVFSSSKSDHLPVAPPRSVSPWGVAVQGLSGSLPGADQTGSPAISLSLSLKKCIQADEAWSFSQPSIFVQAQTFVLHSRCT